MHRFLFLAGLVAACPATAQMSDLDKSLLRQLWNNPKFATLIPYGHEVRSFSRDGGVISGPILWGPNPNELEVTPKGLKTERSVNCDRTRTRSFDGTIGAAYSDIFSFSTTQGAAVEQALSIEATWPGGGLSYSAAVTVSTETGKTEESGVSVSFDHSYLALVDPRHYVDSQLQIVEQNIEDQPFEVDIEITGNAVITHAPAAQWLSGADVQRAAKVKAGTEKDAAGNPRELFICRAEHHETTHPGKIVAGNCNYSYNGTEREASRYEVLSIPKGNYRWISREAFEKDNSDSDVANGDTDAVIAGHEDRVDRYDGQLVVCRAEYKDAWHPGKVVINDCMFGWGGKEIERGKYQVLVRKEVTEETVNIRLSDYLPPEVLKFRVAGKFEGARAADSTIVVRDQRPVTDAMCATATPDDPVPQAGVEGSAPQTSVHVTRTPIAPQKTAALAAGHGSRYATFDTKQGGSNSPKLIPTETEPAINARTQSSAELAAGENPLDWNIRILTLARPFARGADVLVVQRALTEAGWPVLQDGVYGDYTARAVRLFQQANGLFADGVVGPATEARLGL